MPNLKRLPPRAQCRSQCCDVLATQTSDESQVKRRWFAGAGNRCPRGGWSCPDTPGAVQLETGAYWLTPVLSPVGVLARCQSELSPPQSIR
jgi:hypothetical protein